MLKGLWIAEQKLLQAVQMRELIVFIASWNCFGLLGQAEQADLAPLLKLCGLDGGDDAEAQQVIWSDELLAHGKIREELPIKLGHAEHTTVACGLSKR